MCLTSDAAYRIRDADAIFRIERKDDQKIAQNSKLFYRKYFEFATNHSGSVRGTLWRIVSKYILFFCAWFSHFTVGTCRTRRITLRVPRKITTDHDMRPIRLFNTALFALAGLCDGPVGAGTRHLPREDPVGIRSVRHQRRRRDHARRDARHRRRHLRSPRQDGRTTHRRLYRQGPRAQDI